MSTHHCSGTSQCSHGGNCEKEETNLIADLQEMLLEQQQQGDKVGEVQSLHAISSCYFAQGEYDKAQEYLQQSLTLVQELGDKKAEAEMMNNLAQLCNAREEYDNAIAYLEKAMAIQNEINDVEGLSSSIFNLGHLHLQKKDMAQAAVTWTSLYKFAREMDLSDILTELESLAEQLGLPGGNNAWQLLLEQMDKGE